MGARNRVGIGLWYRPARLAATYDGGIDFLKSIPGIWKSFQIRAQASGHIFKDDVNGFFSISDICLIFYSRSLQVDIEKAFLGK
jgi:hypothetical protein